LQLNEYGINDLFPSNILFNYPVFIKHLATRNIGDPAEKWVADITIHSAQINYIKLMYRLLFRIFIENRVNMYVFKVTVLTIKDCKYFNVTID
jgi:hypothetical protein